MTACKDCKEIARGPHINIWYNHRCLAVREPNSFDYMSGEMRLGDYAYCRDVNHGNCEYFEKREESQ